MVDVGLPQIVKYTNYLASTQTIEEQSTIVFYQPLTIPSTTIVTIPANSRVRVFK